MMHQINSLNLKQRIGKKELGTYNANSEIKFKTTMLKSSLCDYRDTYIFVKRKITGAGDDAGARQTDKRDKGVAFKNVLHSPIVLLRSIILKKIIVKILIL